MDQYTKGDTVHLAWEVTNNASGVLVDTTAQTFKYIDPSGAQTNVAYTDGSNGIVHDSTGNYHYDLAVSIPGLWWTRVEITGANAGEGQYNFEVQGTIFS